MSRAAVADYALAWVGEQICAPGFRGCPFINAAAEFPDPGHPVHRAVVAHRAWFHDSLVALLTAIEHPDPRSGADILVMLRDAAMVAGYLGPPQAARDNLAAAVAAQVPAGRTRGVDRR